jgi:hypothetical protein
MMALGIYYRHKLSQKFDDFDSFKDYTPEHPKSYFYGLSKFNFYQVVMYIIGDIIGMALITYFMFS